MKLNWASVISEKNFIKSRKVRARCEYLSSCYVLKSIQHELNLWEVDLML